MKGQKKGKKGKGVCAEEGGYARQGVLEQGGRWGCERCHVVCENQMVKRHGSIPPVDLSWTPDVEVLLTRHNFSLEVVGS